MTSLPPCQEMNPGSSRLSFRPLKPKAPDIMQTEPGPSPHRLLFPISTDRPIVHAQAPREKSKSSSKRKTDDEHEIEELKQLLFVKSEEMLRRDLENLRETGKMKRENDRLVAENTALKDEVRRLKVELHRTRQLRDPVSFFEQKLLIKHPPPLRTMYAPRRSVDREVIEILDSGSERSEPSAALSRRSSTSPVNPWLQPQPAVQTWTRPNSPTDHDASLHPQAVDPSSGTSLMPRPRSELTPDDPRFGASARTTKAPDPSHRPTDSQSVAKESIDIQVQLHDDAEIIKHIYLTSSQDDLWDLTDLELGPPHRTGEDKLNTGFTRKVIGDAFGGQNETFVNWAGSKAKGPPLLAFNRKSNPALPTCPGGHGIVFTTFPKFKDGSSVKQDLPLFVGENKNDWRLYGVYNTERVGHILTTDLDLLPSNVLDLWVSSALKSDWGKDWIRAKNEDLSRKALVDQTPATVVSFTKDGLQNALRSGILRIDFTILQCVGYDQTWHHELLHAQMHPKPRMKPIVGSVKRARTCDDTDALPAKKMRSNSVASTSDSGGEAHGMVRSDDDNVKYGEDHEEKRDQDSDASPSTIYITDVLHNE